jgi:putative transposase
MVLGLSTIIMRRNLFRTDAFPYHVTARSNNKDWFALPIEQCWDIFQQKLSATIERYQIEAHGFVLMSNHFHMMASTPLLNLDEAMRYFLTESSKAIAYRTNRINHIFGGRYKWSVLPTSYAIGCCYKYIFRNPVRAGIVSQVESYPFSTFSALLLGKPTIPLSEGIAWRLPKNSEDRLKWLNQVTSKEQEGLIQMALRRTTFQFSRDKKVQLKVKKLSLLYFEGCEK